MEAKSVSPSIKPEAKGGVLIVGVPFSTTTARVTVLTFPRVSVAV
jgi:hypothetical protein